MKYLTCKRNFQPQLSQFKYKVTHSEGEPPGYKSEAPEAPKGEKKTGPALLGKVDDHLRKHPDDVDVAKAYREYQKAIADARKEKKDIADTLVTDLLGLVDKKEAYYKDKARFDAFQQKAIQLNARISQSVQRFNQYRFQYDTFLGNEKLPKKVRETNMKQFFTLMEGQKKQYDTLVGQLSDVADNAYKAIQTEKLYSQVRLIQGDHMKLLEADTKLIDNGLPTLEEETTPPPPTKGTHPEETS